MSSIGIKTSSKDITYAIKLNDRNDIITHHLNIEPTLSLGKKLLLVKIDLMALLNSLSLVDEEKKLIAIDDVHIKGVEMNAMTINPERIMISGVLIQLFSEYGVENVTSLNKSNIQKILKKVPQIANLFPEKKVKYDNLYNNKIVFDKFTEHFMPGVDFSSCTNATKREAGVNCIIGTC